MVGDHGSLHEANGSTEATHLSTMFKVRYSVLILVVHLAINANGIAVASVPVVRMVNDVDKAATETWLRSPAHCKAEVTRSR